MQPHRPRLVLALLLASLAPAAGCSRVHSRQWGYPSRLGRRIDALKGSGRIGKTRSPRVNLRFEPAPATGARAARSPDG